jgi:hypothetical protein
MAQSEGDFEKGDADGTTATLAVVAAAAQGWLSSLTKGYRSARQSDFDQEAIAGESSGVD